ncbi:Uncharacterised protein [Burkholderia pseudomallei]|nr:Uncharacterised protein [Burkholderia pseudomallei]CPI14599.1 Uncharacterised protein [Burkholderia pseudomallei]
MQLIEFRSGRQGKLSQLILHTSKLLYGFDALTPQGLYLLLCLNLLGSLLLDLKSRYKSLPGDALKTLEHRRQIIDLVLLNDDLLVQLLDLTLRHLSLHAQVARLSLRELLRIDEVGLQSLQLQTKLNTDTARRLAHARTASLAREMQKRIPRAHHVTLAGLYSGDRTDGLGAHINQACLRNQTPRNMFAPRVLPDD